MRDEKGRFIKGFIPPTAFKKGDNLLDNNPAWKGDGVSYAGIHKWIGKKLGKPQVCTFCGSTEEKKYEWANISKEYKRDFSDWIRLCVRCHLHYDDRVRKSWVTRRLSK